MNHRWIAYGTIAILSVVAVISFGLATGALAPYLVSYDADDADGDDYEHVQVVVYDEAGGELGSVEAAVADTFTKRYVGLSETGRLPEDRGMFFVHDSADERTYVMRNMDFGIDIVFIAPNGTITEIHHAPAPGPGEDGNEMRYSGEGQYVLEVNYRWTSDRGIDVGDRVVVGNRTAAGNSTTAEERTATENRNPIAVPTPPVRSPLLTEQSV